MQIPSTSGARDLHPKQVEVNHLISTKLSEVYKLWCYEEVCPPTIEKLSTLTAGGGIRSEEILKVVSDDLIGLRPEMTASIARVASTRLSNKIKPIKLWSSGTVFTYRERVEGGIYIEESLHSGVELFGIKDMSAEIELLSILLESLEKLSLNKQNKTILLVGHTSLLNIILDSLDISDKNLIKKIMIGYDLIELSSLDIPTKEKNKLSDILKIRGNPNDVITKLRKLIGPSKTFDDLQSIFSLIQPISHNYGIDIQLDPTFQSQYKLYNGLMFQLVSSLNKAPVVIARGGRYDNLVKIFDTRETLSSGVGFSFSIDKLRELIQKDLINNTRVEKVLIAFSKINNLKKALQLQNELHKQDIACCIEHQLFKSKEEALEVMFTKGFNKLEWVS